MIQNIESLEAELDHVIFAVGHTELLVSFDIEAEDAGTLMVLRPTLPKYPGRRFGERRRVQPPRWRPVSAKTLAPVEFGRS